ncbi:MAG TPA: DUF6089 family protein [Paludibacteraceae bacterium]|nr:DUF6089 family protein [Paludibacteraceae bacterium]HPH63281.1 DUF6089 family protein [Paludibacteraceae bacterium]
MTALVTDYALEIYVKGRKMHYNNIKCFLVLLFSIFCFSISNAQYVGEFGIMGGISYYNGDANSTTPFVENHPAVGGLLRARINTRSVIKFDLMRATISGNTENFDNQFPNNQQAEFKRDFWDLGLQYELNFFKFGPESWDRTIKCHTPYVLIGPGLAIYQDRGDKNTYAFNIGFGVGYKYKFFDRFNIGIEWSMRKLFRDDFDVTKNDDKFLDDSYKLGNSSLKNNDWYSLCCVYFSIDIIKRKGRCTELR